MTCHHTMGPDFVKISADPGLEVNDTLYYANLFNSYSYFGCYHLGLFQRRHSSRGFSNQTDSPIDLYSGVYHFYVLMSFL
jgi:hypothetical protein